MSYPSCGTYLWQFFNCWAWGYYLIQWIFTEFSVVGSVLGNGATLVNKKRPKETPPKQTKKARNPPLTSSHSSGRDIKNMHNKWANKIICLTIRVMEKKIDQGKETWEWVGAVAFLRWAGNWAKLFQPQLYPKKLNSKTPRQEYTHSFQKTKRRLIWQE